MHKLIARGRLVIGNSVRRAVAGQFGRVDEEIAVLRSELASLSRNSAASAASGNTPTSSAEPTVEQIEALSRRIGLSSPLLWNDLQRPIEPSLPSPRELGGATAPAPRSLNS